MKKFFLALALLLSAAQAHAAMTFVQSATNSSITGDPMTVTLTGTTAGNGLVMLFKEGVTLGATAAMSGETVDAPSPGYANNPTTGELVAVWYVKNLQSGGSKTFTLAPDGGTPPGIWSLLIAEVASHDITTFLDATSATGEVSGQSTSVTTTVANAAVFAVGYCSAADLTPGAGYTALALDGSAEGEYNVDVGTAGAKTVSFGGGGGDCTIFAVAFKPAGVGGGGGGPLNRRRSQ